MSPSGLKFLVKKLFVYAQEKYTGYERQKKNWLLWALLFR